MLDIVLFRVDQGGNPDIVRESQRRRYADVSLVDKVIAADDEWRQTRGNLDLANKAANTTKKAIGEFMKKKEKPPDEMFAEKAKNEADIKSLEEKLKELAAKRDAAIGEIGNLVPDSVPIDDNEDNNAVVDTNGTFEREDWMLSHYDLVQLAGMANTVKGSVVAGSRGYFLTGMGMRLNHALISYAVQFLSERGHTMVQTPFVMNKNIMGKVAQLDDFDEQLYKVSGGAEDQYLIATSEQPLCGYHVDEWIAPASLPLKYAGYSTCFRKEAGSHGRDQAGIFRVHQFEKVEQFCVTSPDGDESWKMQEVMIQNCKDFYQSLGIPYRVVNIVSGALNDAAAKKYDLEAWFPGSNAHRELVSCSNCTDFQSRRLETRYGAQGKGDDGIKKYVHMLNSTLIATERAMCCVLENYQTKCGIKIPDVLQEYMGGVSFVPFVNEMPKPKKGPAPPQYKPTPEQIKEMDSGKADLQKYMDGLLPTLNSALNTIAKTKPGEPVAALAELLAKAAGSASAPAAPMASAGTAAANGDVDYGTHLTLHIAAALNSTLAKAPADPFKAIQQVLFAASLDGSTPKDQEVKPTDEQKAYMTEYRIQDCIDRCMLKMKKRLVAGPLEGVKFLVSDAGDFFTEESKKLKAAGGKWGAITMTAEELAAKDKADAKAKREKEAKAEAERDASDALNAERSAAMEAEGKKVTGGLHKFDASEVDVHGGSGTADDFMDAFGF